MNTEQERARADFEAWAISDGLIVDRNYYGEKEKYASIATQYAFRGWQAGRATPQSQPQETIAYVTRNEEGDPAMLFFDLDEARLYCDLDEEPEALVLAGSALQSQDQKDAAQELRRLHERDIQADAQIKELLQVIEDWERCSEMLSQSVQELGEMARENRSKRVIELEQRIAELEEQMDAIGAGGVDPLRKTSALRAALEEAEAALEVATSRLSARGANYPVHVTSEARALEIVRKALGKSQADHFRDATKMA